MSATEIASARGRRAAAARWGRGPQEIAEASRDLAAAKLEQYVAKTVAAAPPLTREQAERIAALLRPSDGGAAA